MSAPFGCWSFTSFLVPTFVARFVMFPVLRLEPNNVKGQRGKAGPPAVRAVLPHVVAGGLAGLHVHAAGGDLAEAEVLRVLLHEPADLASHSFHLPSPGLQYPIACPSIQQFSPCIQKTYL